MRRRTNKIRKFKFAEVVSENSHEAHLIERIMFLENKIERLYRYATLYQYQNNCSAEFIKFTEVKINNVEMNLDDAMRLEIFKVRKQIIKLLEEYKTRKQKVDSGIFGRVSIDKGYKQIINSLRTDYENIKEEHLVDYIENSELITTWADSEFEKLNKLRPLEEERLNHKKVKSKFAVEIDARY